jgi:hypothetical protein
LADNADLTLRRRSAVVAIYRGAAGGAIDRVAQEASSAAGTFGLTTDRVAGYGERIREILPLAFDAMSSADGPERSSKIDELARGIRGISDQHNVPRLVERGLVALAVRIGREVVRRGAQEQGFAPDELESEYTAFARLLEGRLFLD